MQATAAPPPARPRECAVAVTERPGANHRSPHWVVQLSGGPSHTSRPLLMSDGADPGLQDFRTCFISSLTTRSCFPCTECAPSSRPICRNSESVWAGGGGGCSSGGWFLLTGSQARLSVTGDHFVVFCVPVRALEPDPGLCRNREGEAGPGLCSGNSSLGKHPAWTA